MHYDNNTLKRAQTLGASFIGVAAIVVGCSKPRSAGGNVDTAVITTISVIDAEGPGVHVTRTDSRSVDKSSEYRLTNENFARFLAAADSLDALRNRDSSARTFLTADITDAASTSNDAGLKWLESNGAASNAINSAGISTRDYFVQSIAIASAERFMGDPNAAPPTPTTKENAEFLRGHQADLIKLRALRAGKPVVVSKP